MKLLLSIVLFLAILAEVVLLQWCDHLEKRIDLLDLSGPRIYLIPAPVVSPPRSTAPTLAPAPVHRTLKPKVEKPLPPKKEIEVSKFPKFPEPVVPSPAPSIPLVESPAITAASEPGKECTNPFGCYRPFRPFGQF